VTLIGELMFCGWSRRKKIICGLMRLLDTFQPQRMGFAEKRLGTLLEDQDTKLVHFIGKTISFSLCDFPCDVKKRRSFILPENVPANEFLNLGK
jgi:methionyl-tRNA synthetase